MTTFGRDWRFVCDLQFGYFGLAVGLPKTLSIYVRWHCHIHYMCPPAALFVYK